MRAVHAGEAKNTFGKSRTASPLGGVWGALTSGLARPRWGGRSGIQSLYVTTGPRSPHAKSTNRGVKRPWVRYLMVFFFTSSTRSLVTNAPDHLHCHTVGGVCAQVHASDPAIRKEATPPYETHVGGTQARALSATNMERVIGRLFASRMAGSFRVTSSPLVTSDDTRVTQAEPVGRARGADACGHVQHDGLARPRAARPTGWRLRLPRARPKAFQPS